MTCPASTRSTQVSVSPLAASVLWTTAEVAPGANWMRAEPPGGGPALTVAVGGTCVAVGGTCVAVGGTAVAGACVAVAGALVAGRVGVVVFVGEAAGTAVATVEVAATVVAGAVAAAVGSVTVGAPSLALRHATNANANRIRKTNDRPLRNILSAPRLIGSRSPIGRAAAVYGL
jgi:hypothetical protein